MRHERSVRAPASGWRTKRAVEILERRAGWAGPRRPFWFRRGRTPRALRRPAWMGSSSRTRRPARTGELGDRPIRAGRSGRAGRGHRIRGQQPGRCGARKPLLHRRREVPGRATTAATVAANRSGAGGGPAGSRRRPPSASGPPSFVTRRPPASGRAPRPTARRDRLRPHPLEPVDLDLEQPGGGSTVGAAASPRLNPGERLEAASMAARRPRLRSTQVASGRAVGRSRAASPRPTPGRPVRVDDRPDPTAARRGRAGGAGKDREPWRLVLGAEPRGDLARRGRGSRIVGRPSVDRGVPDRRRREVSSRREAVVALPPSA